MADIQIKKQRYADKENLKELMRYSKDTFATQSEVNEKFYTKEQIDTMLESGSGGTGGSTGGGSEVGDATIKINYGSTNLGSFTTNQSADAIVDIHPVNELIRENFYTKSEVVNLLSNYYTKEQIDIMLNRAGSDKYGMSITADESEGGDDAQGGLSFWNAVERAPGYDGTSQMNIAEDSNTVEDE